MDARSAPRPFGVDAAVSWVWATMAAAVLAVRTRKRDHHHRIMVMMMVVMVAMTVMMMMMMMVVMMIVLRHLDRFAGGVAGRLVRPDEAGGVRNRVQQFGESARGLQPFRVPCGVNDRRGLSAADHDKRRGSAEERNHGFVHSSFFHARLQETTAAWNLFRLRRGRPALSGRGP
jgi:hypothetical protein